MKRKTAAVLAGVTLLGGTFLGVSTRRADASTHSISASVAVAKAAATTATAQTLDQGGSDPPFGSFLGACNTDADCSSGNVCASFKKRGNHCSHPCSTDADCSGGPAARCTKSNRCGLNDPVKTKP
jgi:hypothetical protein